MAGHSEASPKSPSSPWAMVPVPPPFGYILKKAQQMSLWHPPTPLGLSFLLNIILFTALVYPWNEGLFNLPAETPRLFHFKYAVWFLGFFSIHRMVFNYYVAQPLAFFLGAQDITDARKFAQQFLNFGQHVISTAYFLWYCRQQEWFHDISKIWDGFPDQPMDPSFMLMYMLVTGYHLNSLLFHFTDELRQDFLVMFIHHLVTIALLVWSFYGNYVRWGAIVLLLSDSSDIPVCLAKILKYTSHRPLGVCLLPVLISLWFYTRCYLLPFWVVASIPNLYPQSVPLNSKKK